MRLWFRRLGSAGSNRSTRAAFALLVALAWPMAAAARQTAPMPGESPTVAGSVFSDPALPIRTRVGEFFLIALAANRTTGYTWQLVRASDGHVQTVGSSYAVAHSPRLGAGGEQIWIVRAAAAGKTTLTFRYVRPFDKSTDHGAKQVMFQVEVAS